MLKKITLTVFMMTCALFIPVSAQTGASFEKQVALKELVSVINSNNKIENYMNAFYANIQASQDAATKFTLDERTDLTAEERKSIEDSLIASNKKYSMKRFSDKLMQKLNYNQMMSEIMYTIYDKYFTLEEIKNLNLFYKTPTGQKTLKLMSPMAVESMQLTQEHLLPKMQIIIKELMDEDRLEIEQKIDAVKSKPKKSGLK